MCLHCFRTMKNSRLRLRSEGSTYCINYLGCDMGRNWWTQRCSRSCGHLQTMSKRMNKWLRFVGHLDATNTILLIMHTQLLSYVMPQGQGLLHLGFGLFHQKETVRDATVDLFNNLRAFPVCDRPLPLYLSNFRSHAAIRSASPSFRASTISSAMLMCGRHTQRRRNCYSNNRKTHELNPIFRCLVHMLHGCIQIPS
jgi:hypothetical protein